MAKKILSVLSHTEYGNLEDSDIGLFASAFAAVAGNPLSLLLREDLAERGIAADDLVRGVKLLGRDDLGRFVDGFDAVWNW